MYIFKTTATMKPYNKKNWWIDRDIISDIKINSNNIADALKEYAKKVKDDFYITISNNGLKKKTEMYVDSTSGEAIQIGYVITAQTEMEDEYGYWTKQYIDLWVEIIEANIPTF